MNTLSTLGVIAGFIFSVALNGTIPDNSSVTEKPEPAGAYVVNHSNTTIYFKPESFEANPGLDARAAYPIGPGESLFAPVDAIATPAMPAGTVYRVPTGGKIIVNEDGRPEPGNLIAKMSTLLPFYGMVAPPSDGFAMLGNYKMVLLQLDDVRR